MARALAEERRLYEKMRREAEKQTLRADAALAESRRARAAASSSDRELKSLRKRHAALKRENSTLLETATANKQYAQRLEHRASGGPRAPTLLRKNNALREKVKEIEAQLEKERSLVSSQEVNLHRAADEIELLARALEMRADDLEVDGSLKSGLLYEVAKYQQENHRLALELARQKALADRSVEERDESRQRFEVELEKMRTECFENTERDRQLEEATRALASAQQQVRTLATERDVAVGYVQDQADKLTALEQWRVEREARDDGAEDARREDAFASARREAELRAAIDVAESTIASLRAKAQRSEEGQSMAKVRAGEIESALHEAKLEAANANAVAERLTERLFEAEAKGDSAAERIDTLESALRETDGARRQAAERADAAGSERRDVEERLEAEVKHLRAELNAALDAGASSHFRSTRLASYLQRALFLLQAYHHAEEQRGSAAVDQRNAYTEREAAEQRLNEITGQLESLREAKAALQRTLVQQANEAREKQKAAMRARQLAEREASRLEVENARLRVTDASRRAALKAVREETVTSHGSPPSSRGQPARRVAASAPGAGSRARTRMHQADTGESGRMDSLRAPEVDRVDRGQSVERKLFT